MNVSRWYPSLRFSVLVRLDSGPHVHPASLMRLPGLWMLACIAWMEMTIRVGDWGLRRCHVGILQYEGHEGWLGVNG